MKVKKGAQILIRHDQVGMMTVEAIRDFELSDEDWLPVKLVSEEVRGLAVTWVKGEEIPCRAHLCRIVGIK